MVNLNIDGSAILDKVSSAGKDLSFLTGFAGFAFGVTEKFRGQNVSSGDKWYPYSANGLADMIGQIAGNGTAKMIFPNWGGAATFTFNPGAIINKYTAMAIGLTFLKEIWTNKYTRLAYNVASPFLWGAAVGRVFDDPISTAGLIQSNIPTGNYQPNARNGLPVAQKVPWNS